MINFNFNKSCFDKKNCFMFEGRIYEYMKNHPKRIMFRVVIAEDDYDYVTKSHNRKLFAQLRREYARLCLIKMARNL
jgi:ABC-type long-subunit fatty acid transport system fused permease/ATPase subunit